MTPRAKLYLIMKMYFLLLEITLIMEALFQ